MLKLKGFDSFLDYRCRVPTRWVEFFLKEKVKNYIRRLQDKMEVLSLAEYYGTLKRLLFVLLIVGIWIGYEFFWREKVKNDIRELKNEMEVRSLAHGFCAEYYGTLKLFLNVLLLIVGGISASKALRRKKVPHLVFAVAFTAFFVKNCYNTVADLHKMHYKAEQNFQSIADRARSACDSGESASSLRNKYDGLLKDKGTSSEIRYEEWAYERASKEKNNKDGD